MTRTPLYGVSSTSYNDSINGMHQQLAAIAAGINDLPSNIAKSLASIWTTPSTTSESLPTAFVPNSTLLPQLDRKKFPGVVHWEQGLYNSLRKKKLDSNDYDDDDDEDEDDEDDGSVDNTTSSRTSAKSSKVSTTSCYMEDEHGVQLSKTQKDAARAKAKGFWIKLFSKGIAPSSHREVDIDINTEYIALMENSFPWLRYCENHWKSEQIWRNHYTGWLRGAIRRAEKEKAKKAAAQKAAALAEGKVIDVDAVVDKSQNGQETASKRPREDGEMSKPKRRRVEEPESTPPPHSEAVTITTERLRVRSLIPSDYMLHSQHLVKDTVRKYWIYALHDRPTDLPHP